MIDISIITVTFNSKYHIPFFLDSIIKSVQNRKSEIIIVDNNSTDGTAKFISKHYPDIHLIQNETNVGFAKANNQALKKARGRFIIFANPDVIVEEDTIELLLQRMEENPIIGAITPKIINPDGTFSVDCRHDIPSPLTSLWKALGLNYLFPKSKIFGRYNMTFLDQDKEYEIPALSGSFMVFRKSVLEQTGGMDEKFFMYCEDIDLCKRTGDHGYLIWYLPQTRILHFKGESTKKNDFNYIKTFNNSMIYFYNKYYKSKYNKLFDLFIHMGVWGRGFILFIKNNSINYKHEIFIFLIMFALGLIQNVNVFSLLILFLSFIILKKIFSISKHSLLKKESVNLVLFVLFIAISLTKFIFSLNYFLIILPLETMLLYGIWGKLFLKSSKDKVSSNLFHETNFIVTDEHDFERVNEYLQKNHILANPTRVNKIISSGKNHLNNDILFDFSIPIKSIFDIMEKYKKHDFYFYHPKYKTIIGNHFYLGSINNYFLMNYPMNKFILLIWKQYFFILTIIRYSRNVLDIKDYYKLYKIVLNSDENSNIYELLNFSKFQIELLKKSKTILEKMSYLWLFLQVREKESYFSK